MRHVDYGGSIFHYASAGYFQRISEAFERCINDPNPVQNPKFVDEIALPVHGDPFCLSLPIPHLLDAF